MKRVLFISYWYPPKPAAGSLRAGYIAQHLSEFGWEPTVLTTDFPGTDGHRCRVETVPEFEPRKTGTKTLADAEAMRVLSRHPIEQRMRDIVKCFVHVPDDHSSWMLRALSRANALQREERFDAVLSTAPPPNVHFIARAVARKHELPWVADYRDMWSGPYGPYFSRNYGPTRLKIFYAMERWLLGGATLITIVTKGHADAMSRNFKRDGIQVIPNASDSAIWETIEDRRPRDFRFCYAGQIYPGLRTPDLLFSAIAKLRDANDPAGLAAKFDFFGNEPELVLERAARFGLTDLVAVHGLVDRRTALKAEKSAMVLVLLLNAEGEPDPVERANPGSKIFEYSGAQRHILALGPAHNIVRTVISETGLGMFATDEAECMAAIRELYAKFLNGDIVATPRQSNWFATPRDIARRFADILDEAVNEHVAT